MNFKFTEDDHNTLDEQYSYVAYYYNKNKIICREFLDILEKENYKDLVVDKINSDDYIKKDDPDLVAILLNPGISYITLAENIGTNNLIKAIPDKTYYQIMKIKGYKHGRILNLCDYPTKREAELKNLTVQKIRIFYF